jgi:hypothetical protein
MPRNMSFSLTTEQFKARQKWVTRRLGWDFLKPGDLVQAVEKSMGLKKGEKVQRLCLIRIKSIRKEPLNKITQEDVIAEGFPNRTPADFIQMMVDHHRVKPDVMVNRIEFEYVET